MAGERAMRGPRLGLQRAMGAFLAYILAPLLPLLLLLFMLLGVAAAAVLHSDARHRGPSAARSSLLGLGLVIGGFLGLLATNRIATSAFVAGDLDLWRSTLWLRFAVEAVAAAGFYFAALHLAADRSRTLLGLAFGAALAVGGLAVLASTGPADALVAGGRGLDPASPAYAAWREPALVAYFAATEPATLGKALPFIGFAWGYATILGRLRADAQPKDPWKL